MSTSQIWKRCSSSQTLRGSVERYGFALLGNSKKHSCTRRHFVCFQEKALPLREIISRLEKVYCGSIGAEFMHICNLDEVCILSAFLP